jgi:hypothetical protein
VAEAKRARMIFGSLGLDDGVRMVVGAVREAAWVR